jgi:hypothetical protein
MTGSCARALGAAAGLAVALAAAGCGGSGSPTTPATATTATQAATQQDGEPVVLRKPARDAVVRARVRGAAAARITLPVAGLAAPGQTLLVKADCPQRACSRFVLADAAGAFATSLHLALKGSPSRLGLSVDYGSTPSPATAAHATLRVRIHRSAAPRRRVAAPAQTTTVPLTPSPPGASTEPEVTTTATPGTTTARRRLIVVGDSLAVGIRPYLAGDLPAGWQITVDGRVGRPLAEGMAVLAATAIPDPAKAVLAISLFTNDDPTHTAALRSAIATSLSRVGADGCVIWATITRPPVGGTSYAAANRIIDQAATDPRLHVVDWAGYTAAHPSILAADGVHPSSAGYRARAALYAQAAQSCG